MKTLLWKEWREIRLIPVAMTLLFIVITLLWNVLDYQSSRIGPSLTGHYTVFSALAVGGIIYLMSGALSASGLFAAEVGAGSLSFLTMLPLSRSRIWLSKVWAGLISLTLSCAGVNAAAAVWLTTAVTLSKDSKPYLPGRLDVYVASLSNPNVLLYPMMVAFAAALACFAIGLTISLLVDRTLVSAMLSIVACIAIPMLLTNIINVCRSFIDSDYSQLIWVMLALIIPICFASSYYIFLNGETLRTRKRFILLARSFAVWAGINALIIFVFSIIHIAHEGQNNMLL